MTQESRTQGTAVAQPSALASDPSELSEAELALVVGGTDGPPTNAGDHNGRAGV